MSWWPPNRTETKSLSSRESVQVSVQKNYPFLLMLKPGSNWRKETTYTDCGIRLYAVSVQYVWYSILAREFCLWWCGKYLKGSTVLGSAAGLFLSPGFLPRCSSIIHSVSMQGNDYHCEIYLWMTKKLYQEMLGRCGNSMKCLHSVECCEKLTFVERWCSALHSAPIPSCGGFWDLWLWDSSW